MNRLYDVQLEVDPANGSTTVTYKDDTGANCVISEKSIADALNVVLSYVTNRENLFQKKAMKCTRPRRPSKSVCQEIPDNVIPFRLRRLS